MQPYRNSLAIRTGKASDAAPHLVRRHQTALLERGAEVRGLRVDNDGLGDAATRQRVASHLLERDLFWPTDVHIAVERSGDGRAGDHGCHLPTRDGLNQRVGNTNLV